MSLTAGSLFSGIGGIDMAFAAAGFDIRFQVEIDDFCRKVLAKHAPRYWPNAAQHVDVRDVGRAELGAVDVLFGGFPCQDISVAGNGAGLEGERSGLWYEFRRIIGDIRPRIVFIENVPAITGRGGAAVIAHLTAMGYDARWGIVAAADAGAPHQRDRWFCMAYADSIRRHEQSAIENRSDHEVGLISPRSTERWTVFHETVAGRETVADSDSQRARDTPERGIQRRSPNNENRIGQGVGPGDGGFAQLADSGVIGLEARASICGVSETSPQPSTAGARASAGQLSQSGIRRGDDGLSSWLDRPRFPAGSGQPQHAWEPPRQIEKRGPDWSARVKALGNAVVPQVVYPFAVEIARLLEGSSDANGSMGARF